MDLALNTLKTGFIKAIKTTLMLMKVVLPVYAFVVLIKYSPIMGLLESLFAPAMMMFRLPSEAAIPLITGFFTDEYSTIAVTNQFDFTTFEITSIAMINLMCHSLPVEFALSKRIGLPAGKFLLFRVAAALVIGLILAFVGGVIL